LPPPAEKKPPKPRDVTPGALQLLALLQREGRLLDFLSEEIDGYDDAAIGAAVRDIHKGCKKVIHEHFGVEPVMDAEENETVTVDTGFDPGKIRLVGNIAGAPPFRGTLKHHGWRAAKVSLPALSDGWTPPSSPRRRSRLSAKPRYVVGIDLGTTNSALASVDTAPGDAEKPSIEMFPVPQVVAPGRWTPARRCPSYLYVLGANELPPAAVALPWDPAPSSIAGDFARARGAEVPARLVASAKSWLSHPGVDRTAPSCPGVDRRGRQTLAGAASARYLAHLAGAWDAAHPDAPLARAGRPHHRARVVRRRRARAHRRGGAPAGPAQVTLLEEPQAAFYSWLAARATPGASSSTSATSSSVCDVGGGTTDFSLIAVAEQAGDLTLERVAVGDHILLGGDNMDLTLAYQLGREARRQGAQARFLAAAVAHLACRAAKEQLLADTRMAQGPRRRTRARLEGHRRHHQDRARSRRGRGRPGRRLLPPRRGRAPAAHARRAPACASWACPTPPTPRHPPPGRVRRPPRPPPDRDPLNGGVMKGDRCAAPRRGGRELERRRLKRARRHRPRSRRRPRRAYYGWSGAARACASAAAPRARTTSASRRHARRPGMRRRSRRSASSPSAWRRAPSSRSPARSSAWSSASRPSSASSARRCARRTRGRRHRGLDEDIEELAPSRPCCPPSGRHRRQIVPVRLRVARHRVGTLELWCVARDGDRRWKLEYNVREADAVGIDRRIDLGTTNTARRLGRSPSGGRASRTAGACSSSREGELGAARARCPRSSTSPASTTSAGGRPRCPGTATARIVVGELARAQGAACPARLIASSKSWLCHAGVDRQAAICPGAPTTAPTLSPSTRGAQVLGHVARAWQHAVGGAARRSEVVVTVPASFDEVARELTLAARPGAPAGGDAARGAAGGLLRLDRRNAPRRGAALSRRADPGLRRGRRHHRLHADRRRRRRRLLRAHRGRRSPAARRRQHRRRASARRVEARIGRQARRRAVARAGARLPAGQGGSCSARRRPRRVPITVAARGAGSSAGSCAREVTAPRSRAWSGRFLPAGRRRRARRARAGLVELGLPYAADAAVTRHLAAFLARHGATASTPCSSTAAP
jgi:molecular chaperone DnaK (HSP70)